MKSEQSFYLYSDPGHGWLRVPKSLLSELGIAEKITAYSYQRGGFAYLEEDQDLTTFCSVMKARGVEVRFRNHVADRNSRIRGYEPYKRPEPKVAEPKLTFDEAFHVFHAIYMRIKYDEVPDGNGFSLKDKRPDLGVTDVEIGKAVQDFVEHGRG